MLTVAILLALAYEIAAVLTDSQKDEFVSIQNAARSNVPVPTAADMRKFYWDSTLAASAQAYADTCPTGHSSTNDGENLSWGWPTMTVASAIALWTSEVHVAVS
jgi:hypothetical protein